MINTFDIRSRRINPYFTSHCSLNNYIILLNSNLYSLAEQLASKDRDEIGKEIGCNTVGNDQTELALHTAED